MTPVEKPSDQPQRAIAPNHNPNTTPQELSVDYGVYVDQTAAMIGLAIAPAYRDEVVANMQRTAAIAQLVLEFSIPPEIEAAPVFEP
ncbi:MAG: DUF4089 domain-containing protein [Kaiparowitsia implicata GSE-PSE-MK54-09C]|jgi:hypothetical protein|nr:DUF4089 domain-containing protein [Kaiparowitsia implicata GSE-PSE-MK54-09C]